MEATKRIRICLEVEVPVKKGKLPYHVTNIWYGTPTKTAEMLDIAYHYVSRRNFNKTMSKRDTVMWFYPPHDDRYRPNVFYYFAELPFDVCRVINRYLWEFNKPTSVTAIDPANFNTMLKGLYGKLKDQMMKRTQYIREELDKEDRTIGLEFYMHDLLKWDFNLGKNTSHKWVIAYDNDYNHDPHTAAECRWRIRLRPCDGIDCSYNKHCERAYLASKTGAFILPEDRGKGPDERKRTYIYK